MENGHTQEFSLSTEKLHYENNTKNNGNADAVLPFRQSGSIRFFTRSVTWCYENLSFQDK